MSDSDSSSSDDMPLAALKGKKGDESSEEAEFDDEDVSSDEEVGGGDDPDSEDFIVEDSDDDGDDDGDYESDSDDDVPLTALKSKKKKELSAKKKKKATPAKKTTSAKKAAPKKKASTSAKKKKATSSAKKATPKSKQSSSSSSNYLCASSELYANSEKGKLIQHLLARWWYAYQWPDPTSLPSTTPPGYDALDGFPGVYICTRGGEVGKFLDKRNHALAPTFKNFAKKDSEELRGMLLRAVEAQMKVLVKLEGTGTATEKQLVTIERWATKLNCGKADREAEKVLKAKKLKL